MVRKYAFRMGCATSFPCRCLFSLETRPCNCASGITGTDFPRHLYRHVWCISFFSSVACYNLNQPMVDLDPMFEVIQRDNELANISLIQNGLLGCTPTSPELTITFQCLELYHQLCRCQSSFGIQAYAKVLCVLHRVSGFKLYSVATDLY